MMDCLAEDEEEDSTEDDPLEDDLDPLDLYPSWKEQRELVQSLCRLCTKSGGASMLYMFPTANGDNCISSTVSSVFLLEVHKGYGLPNWVCKDCVSRLESAQIFKQQCIDADKILSQLTSKCFASIPRAPMIKTESGLKLPFGKIPPNVEYCTQEEAAVVEGCGLVDFPEPLMKLEVLDCPQVIQEFDSKDNLQSDRVKKLTCDICFKLFKRKQYLSDHRRIHTNEKPFKCEGCQESFRWRQTFSHHQQICKKNICRNITLTEHSAGKRMYKCTKCKMSFFGSRNFSAHAQHCNQRSSQQLLHSRQFKCVICSKFYFCKAHLQRHVAIHNRNGPYKCEVCSQRFLRRDHMIDHQRIHTGGRPYQREVCKTSAKWRASRSQRLRFSKEKRMPVMTNMKVTEIKTEINSPLKTLKMTRIPASHKNTNKQRKLSTIRPFPCDTCPQSFKQKSHLVDHQRIHTGEKPFQCKNCGTSFMWKSTCNNHVALCKERNLSQMKRTDSSTGSRTLPKSLEVKRTRASHKKILSQTSLLRPFSCITCQTSFDTKVHLMEHQRIHAGKKLFCCDTCGTSFQGMYSLNMHVKYCKTKPAIKHSDSVTKVRACPKSFKVKRTSAFHENLRLLRRFPCVTCKRLFTTKSHLKEHQRIHTGEKPFQCKNCEASFRWRYARNIHVKSCEAKPQVKYTDSIAKVEACPESFKGNRINRHESQRSFNQKSNLIETGEKSFRCENCGISLRQKSILTQHYRYCKKTPQVKHTESVAEVRACPKSFKVTSTLAFRSNARLVRRFPCVTCKRSFIRKSHLIEHQRIHTGEKPFQCENCGTSFRKIYSLHQHNARKTRCTKENVHQDNATDKTL